MTKDTFVTIMAGGIGSRFWPLSRKKVPKQFLDLLGTGKSLLQMTYDRFSSTFDIDKIFIVTSHAYADLVKQQIPGLPYEQILLEPLRKNTAPCIAYTACKLQQLHSNSTMIVSPADHLILEQDQFIQTITNGVEFVQNNHSLLTLGIKPTKPHTGYGYIQHLESYDQFKQVKLFTEKPTLDFAKEFLASGDFLWNSGIFIWKTQRILESFKEFLPDIYDIFSNISYNTPQEADELQKGYSLCPNISIDYGILEKEKNIYVLPANFSWSDLGTWDALHEIAHKDEHQNASNTELIQLYQSSNNIVHVTDPKKLVVLKDVDNLIVVSTKDSIVICNKDSEQQIKDIVTHLKTINLDEYL